MCRYRARETSPCPGYGPSICEPKHPRLRSELPIETPARRAQAEGGPVAPPGRRPEPRGWVDVHARSTTIQAQTSTIDGGIAYMRDDVMPELENLDGYVGMSLLVDRESGRCVITAAYESEDAMQASADKANQLRSQASDKFGGSIEKIEEWEIAVLHRDHESNEGACARVTWIKIPPDQADRATGFYKSDVLPSVEELAGF